MRKILFVFIYVYLFSLCGVAQGHKDFFSIKGSVHLAKADIMLVRNMDNAIVYEGETDSNGAFVLQAEKGNYSLFVGKKDVILSTFIPIEVNGNMVLDVVIKNRSSLWHLEHLNKMYAYRLLGDTAVFVFNPDSKYPVDVYNAYQLLDRIGIYGLKTKGNSKYLATVEVDNVYRKTNLLELSRHLQLLPVQDIAYVEILPASADNPGGVIRIITQTDKNSFKYGYAPVYESNPPDYEQIKKAISDPSSAYYYPNLLLRFKSYDPTLSGEDYKYLYYGYVFQKGYDPYMKSPYEKKVFSKKKHAQTFSEKDYQKKIDLVNKSLDIYPLDLRMLYHLCVLYNYKGDKDMVKKTYERVHQIILVIRSTGEGQDCESACHVISPFHIDAFFTSNTIQSRSITHDKCEYVKADFGESGIRWWYKGVNYFKTYEP